MMDSSRGSAGLDKWTSSSSEGDRGDAETVGASATSTGSFQRERTIRPSTRRATASYQLSVPLKPATKTSREATSRKGQSRRHRAGPGVIGPETATKPTTVVTAPTLVP